MATDSSSNNIVLRMSPLQRFLISLLTGAGAWALMSPLELHPLIKGLLGWIVFSVAFLLMDWVVIFKRTVDQIRKHARRDDGSKAYVFLLILLASVSSMVGLLLLSTLDESKGLEAAVAVGVMVLSWLMIQTQFLFHYAHNYYNEDEDGHEAQAGGLKFPEEEMPDYLDFAYFSFCMGCCFQVSDVAVTSKIMRRMVMVHGLVAFFINTFIVALTINQVAGISH